MDEKQTYLLNGLLARHFALGRIVRFRHVGRGRQAETFELFTAQEKEYLVQLYPAGYSAERLEFAARAVNALDGQRFSVVPFVGKAGAGGGGFVAEGPQHTRMMVSLAPVGSAIGAEAYTEHDVSQVGLRLAWMHRLLKEQLPAEEEVGGVGLAAEFGKRAGELAGGAEALGRLREMLLMPTAMGWAHGDVQVEALLHDGDHQLRAVTDWGLLHRGCPLEDVVDAFVVLAVNGKGGLDVARGKVLLEAYDSLMPIGRIPWTPVVGRWCAQHLVDGREVGRGVPGGFGRMVERPEELATALASCM